MPAPIERSETDANNSLSERSDIDETVAAAGPAGASGLSGFGPPAATGEVGTLGPYRLVKELGKGGMGAVYATLDTRLDRQLALKVMLPQFAADASAMERFLREARAAARIKHDNVVTVYEADERNGVPYIAMEFLEGYPLDAYLKKKGLPTIPQVLRIAAEAAAGLAAAHKIGLVHRDIKPANLWLEAPNGRVKVLDFGLAKPVDAESEVTKSGAVVGTPAYMSPEQARGERVDHRTDLFSLGAVLYRLCTGKRPFEGPTTMAVLMALGTEEPPAVRELNPAVPESLAALTHQLLAKSADARPQTAEEVVKRLRAIAQDLAAPLAQPVEHSTSLPQLVHPQLVVVPIPVTVVPEANPFADIDAADATEHEPASSPATPTAARAKSGGKTMWMFAGLAALVAAVAVAGVIIALKNRDKGEAKVEAPNEPKGKPPAQGGPGKVPAADPSADRAAAEFALSLGGAVRVNGQDRDLKAAADLPKERFTLTGVSIGGTNVTDAALAHFKACQGLTHLLLRGSAVTDTGLAHFRDCKGLTWIDLEGTAVTDAGLVYLKDCKGLSILDLGGTKVTDAGLVYLKDCKTLANLTLGGCTAVTGAGLVHLRELKGLTNLNLGGTSLTDEGLGQLRGCDGLTTLSLNGTKVTDAGLARLKGHTGLRSLNLTTTPVSDAGLVHLKDCPSLELLILHGTRATSAGLAALKGLAGLKHIDLRAQKVEAKELADFHAAVPGCQIFHDGGVIEAVDVDRKAAEFVLSLGGTVLVSGRDHDIKAAAELPKEPFTLTGVKLTSSNTTDAGLAHIKDCERLTVLDLSYTKVTDAGLAQFKDRKVLTVLALNGTAVTDAGLAHFKACKGLTGLALNTTALTDAGLAHFKDCRDLNILDLRDTALTDAGLAHFKDCKALTRLDVSGTQVTDAGLGHLKDCKGLTYLYVRKTPVTAKGLEAFHAAVPACRIEHDGGVIEPKK